MGTYRGLYGSCLPTRRCMCAFVRACEPTICIATVVADEESLLSTGSIKGYINYRIRHTSGQEVRGLGRGQIPFLSQSREHGIPPTGRSRIQMLLGSLSLRETRCM